MSPAAAIGQRLFLDTSLSFPPGQGCISCHQSATAFADPRRVSPGAVPGHEGIRNSPSLMYAALIPALYNEDLFADDGSIFYAWEGGLFHDGRAQDQFEQIQGPLFDKNEMNIPDEAALAKRIRATTYASAFKNWIGDDAWNDDEQLSYHVYRALIEFLKEPLFRPFDARIDDFLSGDDDALSAQEKRGLTVFKEIGKCADCHFIVRHSWEKPLLSDYGYDNIGAPSTSDEKDPGLGGHIDDPDTLGQFRAPSLRNVALTAPYLHNGSIATLKEVMEFYNKRDLEPERWDPTDYPETVNRVDMGDLKMTDQQVEDLTALMDAFTDRSLLNMEPGQLFPDVVEGTPLTEERRYYFPEWTQRLHPAFPGAFKRSETN